MHIIINTNGMGLICPMIALAEAVVALAVVKAEKAVVHLPQVKVEMAEMQAELILFLEAIIAKVVHLISLLLLIFLLVNQVP